MLIELKGFGVENKGGELMYLAVVDALRRADIGAALAVEPREHRPRGKLGQPTMQSLERAALRYMRGWGRRGVSTAEVDCPRRIDMGVGATVLLTAVGAHEPGDVDS